MLVIEDANSEGNEEYVEAVLEEAAEKFLSPALLKRELSTICLQMLKSLIPLKKYTVLSPHPGPFEGIWGPQTKWTWSPPTCTQSLQDAQHRDTV